MAANMNGQSGSEFTHWTPKKIDEIIVLFESHPCLYNTKLKEYRDRDTKSQALEDIAVRLGTTSDEVYKKLKVLRTQYRREKHRGTRVEYGGTDVVPVTKWAHFERLQFLDEFTVPRKRVSHFTLANGFGEYDRDDQDEDVEYDDYDVHQASEDTDSNLIDYSSLNIKDEVNEDSFSGTSAKRSVETRERICKRHKPEVQELGGPEGDPPLLNAQQFESQELELSQSAMFEQAFSHIGKAFSCFEKATGGALSRGEDDDDMIFARYIASELKKFEYEDVKRLVKHKIQNLIFEAHCTTSTSAYPQ